MEITEFRKIIREEVRRVLKHKHTFKNSLNESSGDNVWIYLDDIRTPLDKKWIVVRNYKDFVKAVEKYGVENIDKLSFDHDLNDFTDGSEKTGKSAANWFIENFMNLQDSDEISGEHFPKVTAHSDNPVGVQNIIGLVNSFLKNLSKHTGKQYAPAIVGKPPFIV